MGFLRRYAQGTGALRGLIVILGLIAFPEIVGAQCGWRPVEAAKINSHAQGPPWCYPGEFMTAFDLDGPRHYAPSDAPVVGQAMCCPAGAYPAWANLLDWSPVGQAGFDSHFPGSWQCLEGHFIVAFDLDGRAGDPHDSPVVGAVLCASVVGEPTPWTDASCAWRPVENAGINSHQPSGSWCEPGEFLVSFDQDGPRHYAPHDTPIIGQAKCCRP